MLESKEVSVWLRTAQEGPGSLPSCWTLGVKTQEQKAKQPREELRPVWCVCGFMGQTVFSCYLITEEVGPAHWIYEEDVSLKCLRSLSSLGKVANGSRNHEGSKSWNQVGWPAHVRLWLATCTGVWQEQQGRVVISVWLTFTVEICRERLFSHLHGLLGCIAVTIP